MNELKRQICLLDEDPLIFWKITMNSASDFISKRCEEIIKLCKTLKHEVEKDNEVMPVLKKIERESFIINRAAKDTQNDAKNKYKTH